jgi:tRNA threonylcarbamoyladenosine biosynthesis protein TsaE
MEIDYSDLSAIDANSTKIIAFAGDLKIWLFDGEMGTGKTTLIKAVCRNLGVSEEQMSSPTFSIVNEYTGKDGLIYHFDLYRLKHIGELFDIGFEEYLDSGNYCLIEWPELAKSFLRDHYLEITLKKTDIRRHLFLRKHVQ